MEGPRNSSSRKRKTREMSRGQVVLALPAPSVPLPPHLSTTATKMAGSTEKPKEVVLAHSAPNAPPPPLHTTTKRAGAREKPIVVIDRCALNASPSLLHTTATKRAGKGKKAKEVALAPSPPNAPPPPLKFMTARKVTAPFDPDHHPQTPPVSARREQEKEAAAPALQEPDKKKPNASPSLLHTTATKRAGTRKKAKEVALALSPPIAPPPPLNITTAPKVTTAFDPDHHPQTLLVSVRREQEEGAAAPALQEPEKKKPNASPSLLHTTATKRAGTRKKAKEVALVLSPPIAPPLPLNIMTAPKVTTAFDPDHHPQTLLVSARREQEEAALALQEPEKKKPNASPSLLHTTATKRAGTRKKAKEVAVALSPPIAPPPRLNITTAPKVTTAFDPDYHPQTLPVSARREQEEGAAAPALQEPEKKKPKLKVVGVRFLDPDATESSSDDDYIPPVTNGRKRKEVEIVHEIKLLGKNPISKTRRKIIKDQKNEKELVGEKIVIKKEIGSSSCGEKVKESSSTSSTAGKEKTTTKGKKKTETKKKKTTEVVNVMWEIPGEIPDLDLLEREKDWLLYRFFDGVPEYCEDIPPEVKVIR